MAYSSPILESLNDFALKTHVGSNTLPGNSSFRRCLNHPVLSQGNSYPDHLFQSARRLLHRIALNDGSRGDDRRWISIDIIMAEVEY
jgi:hypothetical protein